MSTNDIGSDQKFIYEKLWRYFEMHAKQRIHTFYLYVLLDGYLFKTYLYISAKKDAVSLSEYLITAGIISLLIIIVALVFWSLDKRNNFMVSNSRILLIDLESEMNDNKYNLYGKVECATKENNKNTCALCFTKYHYRFEICFRVIFIASITLGFVGLLYPILNHVTFQ
jgi:hypothetical protein